jgi:alkylation response protein AidB-like acyl-CoA dehydrogenase
MDFRLTEEQETLRAAAAEFARKELDDDLAEREREGRFSRAAWQKCADFGLLGLPIPEKYGGAGSDILTTMLALEGLGYGCSDNGLIFSLNAQLWAVETPMVRFGTEEQKQRYLPELCRGSLIGAHAMSEPESGSDAYALATTARETGSGYVLTGSKTFVTNAPEADVFLVFATTNRARAFAALCAFLVHRDTPGLSVGGHLSKMGLRTSPMSELFLDECEVPREYLLGRPGAGMAIFDASMRLERSCILASCVGTMQRQLDRSVAYAKERRQFGEPIGSFQAVSHRIVDMKLRLETARLLLYQVGWLIGEGESPTLEAALTNLHLAESFLSSSLDAVQIHGGYGYMTEYELERDVRDAVGSRIYSGTSEIQRNIVARSLGL